MVAYDLGWERPQVAMLSNPLSSGSTGYDEVSQPSQSQDYGSPAIAPTPTILPVLVLVDPRGAAAAQTEPAVSWPNPDDYSRRATHFKRVGRFLFIYIAPTISVSSPRPYGSGRPCLRKLMRMPSARYSTIKCEPP